MCFFFEKGWCFGIALFYDVYFRKSACMFVNFGILSFLFLVPSSSGLGRGPLKAATRVQIPLGSPLEKAVMKMAAFSFISKVFNKFGCFIFGKCHFGRIFRTRCGKYVVKSSN